MTADKAATLTLILASVLGLSACDERINAGPMRTETRNVGSFDSIDLDGAAKIEIRVGKPASVVVEGREGAIDAVQTDVRGDTLYIESKPRHWFVVGSSAHITLKIGLPSLESLKLEGGNDVRLSGFDGGESNIDVTGATHITAQGRLDELTVRMAGAGSADLSKLVANEAKVTVEGVASVIVHPKDTLDATMNGVGAIYYTGSPRNVNTRMNGLGTIGRRDPEDSDADDGAVEADPAELQPEYENRDEKATGESTVII